jgi:hypothetical protein
VPSAARAHARDAPPAAAPTSPSATSTSAAPARDASAAASAASRSTPAAVARGGSASAPRGRHDPLAAPAGVAVADEERQADAARRAVRRPWRTCFADARPTTATSPRTRGKRKRGASADAPRVTTAQPRGGGTEVLKPLTGQRLARLTSLGRTVAARASQPCLTVGVWAHFGRHRPGIEASPRCGRTGARVARRSQFAGERGRAAVT